MLMNVCYLVLDGLLLSTDKAERNYVKNLDKDNTGNVAGMLLYARTQEQITPNNKYSMGGNIIWLNLNLPFTQITEQLEKIAGNYFGKDE